MASFFRWRIADKVISFLQNSTNKALLPSTISSFVKVSRDRNPNPQLFLPWKSISNICGEHENLIDPSRLVTLIRNQGLPTAEGFLDIELNTSPAISLVFTVDKHVYSKIVLADICANDSILASHSCLFQDISKKKIVVNCSSPKIGNVFNMLHFRSTIHAAFVTNILKEAGHKVFQTTDVSDYGLISALVLTGYKEYGNDNKLLENPCEHICNVTKVMKSQFVNDLSLQEAVMHNLKLIQKGDSEEFQQWIFLRNMCMEQYDPLYKKAGIEFDETLLDSLHSSEIIEISERLLKKNLVHDTGKVNLKNGVKEDKASCTNVEDPTLYNLSRNLYVPMHMKKMFDYDLMYYVLPSAENDHFSMWNSMLQELHGDSYEELHLIKLQNISHFEGKKKCIPAIEFLNEGKQRLLEKLYSNLYIQEEEHLEEMAEALSYSSICVHDMKHRRNVDYAFKWDDVLHLGRNSGASLQLCHAGLKGLQEETEFIFTTDVDTSPLLEAQAYNLVQHLSRFDEMVFKSYLTLEPCVLLQYLFTLWYFTDKSANILKLDIKSDRLTVIKARLLLLSATLKVLEKGLNLLGLRPFENSKVTRSV